MKIEFYSKAADSIPNPKPASHFIPEKYKKVKSFCGQGHWDRTVKKCMPFLDTYMTGYIIPFPFTYVCEYNVEEERMTFRANQEIDLYFGWDVQDHTAGQLPEELRHNTRTVDHVFKFMNPWYVKTPPGYSCLVTTPYNHDLPFVLYDGIVDTDNHPWAINLPFSLTKKIDLNKPIVFKGGSPMAQIIPFKRESWKHTIEKKQITEKEYVKWNQFAIDMYKRIAWSKKEFK